MKTKKTTKKTTIEKTEEQPIQQSDNISDNPIVEKHDDNKEESKEVDSPYKHEIMELQSRVNTLRIKSVMNDIILAMNQSKVNLFGRAMCRLKRICFYLTVALIIETILLIVILT